MGVYCFFIDFFPKSALEIVIPGWLGGSTFKKPLDSQFW